MMQALRMNTIHRAVGTTMFLISCFAWPCATYARDVQTNRPQPTAATSPAVQAAAPVDTAQGAQARNPKLPAGPLVRRVTLVVADIERSLRLYRDVLGFTVNLAPREVAKEGSGYTIFRLTKGITARFATLSAGPGQLEILGLMEDPAYRPPDPDAVRPVALVIKIAPPLGRVEARLIEVGATLMPPSFAGTNREQALLDADGHLIALYELQ